MMTVVKGARGTRAVTTVLTQHAPCPAPPEARGRCARAATVAMASTGIASMAAARPRAAAAVAHRARRARSTGAAVVPPLQGALKANAAVELSGAFIALVAPQLIFPAAVSVASAAEAARWFGLAVGTLGLASVRCATERAAARPFAEAMSFYHVAIGIAQLPRAMVGTADMTLFAAGCGALVIHAGMAAWLLSSLRADANDADQSTVE